MTSSVSDCAPSEMIAIFVSCGALEARHEQLTEQLGAARAGGFVCYETESK